MNPDERPAVQPADSGRQAAGSAGNGEESAKQPDSGPGIFHVRLDGYEGPLDALLDLIKKQGLNILDIPIAKITEQYLESLRVTQELDFEVSAEFVMMAATLIHIKSKALLPVAPSVDEDPPEESQEDLVQRLLEREKFLRAAQMLREKRVVEENVWTAGAKESIDGPDEDTAALEVSLYDLVQTFGDVLERLKNEPVVELEQEQVSVGSRIQFLKQLLLSQDGPVSIHDVLRRLRSARAVVATFLALLEMVKARAIRITQEEVFGEISIDKHEEFDHAFQAGALFHDPDAAMEYSS